MQKLLIVKHGNCCKRNDSPQIPRWQMFQCSSRGQGQLTWAYVTYLLNRGEEEGEDICNVSEHNSHLELPCISKQVSSKWQINSSKISSDFCSSSSPSPLMSFLQFHAVASIAQSTLMFPTHTLVINSSQKVGSKYSTQVMGWILTKLSMHTRGRHFPDSRHQHQNITWLDGDRIGAEIQCYHVLCYCCSISEATYCFRCYSCYFMNCCLIAYIQCKICFPVIIHEML